MKSKKQVSYFPVDSSEQALLLRVREPDLAEHLGAVTEMVGQLAEARLTPADLEQAIQLLVESRQGEGLDARFDNLEGRLRERLEKGLAEIEGRLSRRLTDGPPTEPSPTVAPPAVPAPIVPSHLTAVEGDAVPKAANIAFRIGHDVVWGPSAAQFYVAVWRWLFERGHVKVANLPILSGKSRFTAAIEPVHPSGKGFTRAEQPIPGVFLEVNLSRNDIMRRAKRALSERGVSFDVVVGSAD